MKLKVSSQFSGVISRGSYENSRPGFTAELELDIERGSDYAALADRYQKELQAVCLANFKACEEQAIIERIQKERADIRFYPWNGLQLPSVTSVIGFDADMYCTPEDLVQYASQSNLCHAQVQHFIATGEWKEAKDVPDTWTDIVIVTKGSLKLETNGWSFPDFLAKYPIKDLKNSVSGINEEHRYAGTPDFEGVPAFTELPGKTKSEKIPVLQVPTICDVKRTPDVVKNFKQMAAYAKMKGNEHIKQMMIVPLNNKTEQGFSKPIVETRIDQYFSMFLKDREAFQKRFGV